MKKLAIGVALILSILVVTIFLFRDQLIRWVAFEPTPSSIASGEERGWSDIKTVASDLYTPWSIAFLPQGDLLVTERDGNIKRIGKDGQTYPVNGVTETSEGGLLGLALHPNFAANKQLYLYFTTSDSGRLTNQVVLYTLKNDTLEKQRAILENIPAASNHNGGGIAFGPDKKLYVTTGDASLRDEAQNTASLAGKILRLNDDGSTPSDNPFGNLTWTYGHRNPQGITWDAQGGMWSVEHGPSGEWKGRGKDELNYIEKGANYGWPVIAGSESHKDMRQPVVQSGDNETWAPVAIAHLHGSLFFTGLRGETLYEAKINSPSQVTLSRHFVEKFGRLRAAVAKDSTLYFSTSNRDGRGSVRDGDDKILNFTIK